MNHYHITFDTYGTRLHGGNAPTVHHSRNELDESFVSANEELYRENRDRMKESPCFLSQDQRLFVEERIPMICERGGWTFHVVAAQPEHVHVLLSAEVDPKAVRKWLKTWLTQSLNEKYGTRTWFAKDGSTKWINDEQYFKNVFQYILKQRTQQE